MYNNEDTEEIKKLGEKTAKSHETRKLFSR